jgi:membrane protein DedA with SNARE-associated domain
MSKLPWSIAKPNLCNVGVVAVVSIIIDVLQEFSRTLQSLEFAGLGMWAYVLLALLVAAEGPFVTALAGAAVATGLLHAFPAWMAAVIGNTMSDWGWYALGFWGRVPAFLKERFRVSDEFKEDLRREIQRHAIKLLMAAKFTAGFGVATLVTLGNARIPWRRWSGPLFLAECTRAAIMMTIGYILASAVNTIEHGLGYLFPIGVVVFTLMIGNWLLKRRRQRPAL